ncbi:unnamed protein product [Spirodela intermedia]|uniref:Uncharacterized protein n=2 Tax=Spirodela intermedia TaxID=51605 RepID=A0A7I8KZF8_SPIIN|nr:unnamed protein product [Spirodela intermedia]CAA6665600.1 unnamed protein product [Spirodela intermedia]CAA7402334.1 unnamed protein product [Spirodela intermedia]
MQKELVWPVMKALLHSSFVLALVVAAAVVGSCSRPQNGEARRDGNAKDLATAGEEDYSYSEPVPVMCPGVHGAPIPHA